jgi:hypothetical protein
LAVRVNNRNYSLSVNFLPELWPLYWNTKQSKCSPSSSRTVLRHDNVVHTHVRTTEAITKCGSTELPHPTYNSNFAPSHFHPFGTFKDKYARTPLLRWWGMRNNVRQWLQTATLVRTRALA